MERVKNKVKLSADDRVYYGIANVVLFLFLLAVLYPLIFIVLASFSSAQAVTSGRVVLWPVDLSIEGYKAVFKHPDIWNSYKNAFEYTIVGTAINLVFTMIAAYPLSRPDMPHKGMFMFLFTFTMMFNGGMIPDYILLKDLRMIDTMWALVIPGAINVFNLITFTQDGPAFKSVATAGDRNTIGVVCTAGMGQLFTTSMTDRKAEYVPLDPMIGPEGVQYAAYYPTQPSPIFTITRDCKNPEAVFRLADFFFDQEATLFSRFGEPGVDWTEPDPDGVALGQAYGAECTIKAILVWGGSSHKSHWSNVTPNIMLQKWMDGQQWNGDPTDAEYMIAQSTATLIDKAPDEACNLIIYDPEEAEQIADIKTSLETYVKESMARFATGDMSIERDWDSYVKELENIGLQTYIEVSQKAYDRMNGKV